jgi:hypothetical protein
MTLEEGLIEILKIVYMVAFMYGVILIMEGAWKIKSGDATDVKMAIISVMLLAAGPMILRFLFDVFGFPGAFNI